MFDNNNSQASNLNQGGQGSEGQGPGGQGPGAGTDPLNKASQGIAPQAGDGSIPLAVAPDSSTKPAAPPIKKQRPTAKSEIEDMFSDTENTEKPAVFQPKPSQADSAGSPPPSEPEPAGHHLNKIYIIVLAAATVCLIGIGGYYAYNKFVKDSVEAPADSSEPAGQPSGGQKQEEGDSSTASEPEPQAKPALPADSDSDGLSDEEENNLGMDINSVDTDKDGLFDREEVKVYKTNPLVPDTDGDGKLDGEEVREGLNPNGDGRLYDIEKGGNEPAKDQTLEENGPETAPADLSLIDTDKDGLSDGDELNIYKTDPNNPDTDGDTYLDGEEVQSGHNPNGAGKL